MSANHAVLAITPPRLGDTIFCTPALRFLKTVTNADLDVIALSDLSASTLQYNPAIRTLWTLPELSTLSEIPQYRKVINLTESSYAKPYLDLFEGKAYSYEVSTLKRQPAAENLLEFVAHITDKKLDHFPRHYDLYPQLDHKLRIEKFLQQHHVAKTSLLIGLHMGCHGLAKSRKRFWRKSEHDKAWPLENYMKLTTLLHQADQQVRMVLTGSKAEQALGEKFCRAFPDTINLIDKTSVLELAALMSYLGLFITNDTGALHVACATPVKLIALFSKSDPMVTGPYPEQSNRLVLHRPCISDITVTDVAKTVRILLA